MPKEFEPAPEDSPQETKDPVDSVETSASRARQEEAPSPKAEGKNTEEIRENVIKKIQDHINKHSEFTFGTEKEHKEFVNHWTDKIMQVRKMTREEVLDYRKSQDEYERHMQKLDRTRDALEIKINQWNIEGAEKKIKTLKEELSRLKNKIQEKEGWAKDLFALVSFSSKKRREELESLQKDKKALDREITNFEQEIEIRKTSIKIHLENIESKEE